MPSTRHIIGFLVLTGVVVWSLVVVRVPALYITIVCGLLLALGLIAALSKARARKLR